MNHRGGRRALPPAMPTPSPEDDFTIAPASEAKTAGSLRRHSRTLSHHGVLFLDEFTEFRRDGVAAAPRVGTHLTPAMCNPTNLREDKPPREACELHGETDPAVLRLALKAVDKDGYWWVQCGACDTGWQVPYYAESVG